MQTFRILSLTFLFAALGAAPSLAQQSSGADAGPTLTSHALDAALAEHDTKADKQRAELTDLLSRAAVREVARDRGIDMGRVESAAAGLSDGQVTAILRLMDAVPQDGDGGGLGTITVGVGALIVGLLILILVT